ncbi:MAG: CUB domain-containing protein, partial [Bacteroidota bacterium]
SGQFMDGSGPLDDYLPNLDASWLLDPQTEEDSITDITLYFIDLDLGSGDYLRIYDGEDATATMLGEYTGSTLPPQFTSTGNKLFITLTTDGSGSGSGFKAEFYSDYPSYCVGSPIIYTDPIGTFDDGSGSFNYAPGTTCMYKIEPPYATEITVIFNYFDTEEDHDALIIYDGNTNLGTFSGDDIPGPFTCVNGSVFLAFSSNSTFNAPGWEISYEITNVGVKEEDTFTQLDVFPNPTNGVLNVNFRLDQQQSVEMRLVNVTGEAVYANTLSNVSGNINNSIDVSNFAKGIYILNLSSADGSVNKKVIIK